MSETTAINLGGTGSSADEKSADKKKKTAAFATAAATAAGAGVAVSSMMSDGEEVVEEVTAAPSTDGAEAVVQQEAMEPEGVVTEEIVAEPISAEKETVSHSDAQSASNEEFSHHAAPATEAVSEDEVEDMTEIEAETMVEGMADETVAMSETEAEAVSEIETETGEEAEVIPESNLDTESITISDSEGLPEGALEPVVEIITEEEPEGTIEIITDEEGASELTFEEVAQTLDDYMAVDPQVNANELAEAIISEEQVDPNDIDTENVINFQEVGTMYTADGLSHAAASFQDANGNNLVMVDMNDDGVFDVFTDNNGNVLAAVGGHITVDDAEMHVAGDGGYLAFNDTQITDDFGADSIDQDLLT